MVQHRRVGMGHRPQWYAYLVNLPGNKCLVGGRGEGAHGEVQVLRVVGHVGLALGRGALQAKNFAHIIRTTKKLTSRRVFAGLYSVQISRYVQKVQG